MGQSGFKVVAIGGGLGAVQIMQGMQRHTDALTGIIAVTDTGRSTGIVREFAQIPAPGDIRNALATLALDDDSLLTRVMQHRIVAPGDPQLDGMAFGNLFIAALTQMSGSFVMAINQLSDFLNVRGEYLSGHRREHAYLRRAGGWHDCRAGVQCAAAGQSGDQAHLRAESGGRSPISRRWTRYSLRT